MQRKKREKQEAQETMQTMQVVRALLAARELTTIISQRCTKKNTAKRLWGRGRRMKTVYVPC